MTGGGGWPWRGCGWDAAAGWYRMWDVHSGWTGERTCPHCGAQLQSASHAFFECPFFEEWREEQEGMFTPGMSLAEFFQQEDQEGVARFVAGCQQLAVEGAQ